MCLLVQDRSEKEHGGGGAGRKLYVFTTCHSTGKGLLICFCINVYNCNVDKKALYINIHCEYGS